MFHVNTEDCTVPWGRAPDPLDVQTGRYRMAVFQDVVESLDKSLLYFLYDPVADEESGTTGGRKGNPGIVVFDINRRCFTQEIPLGVQGSLKFLFGLKCPSPSGGTSLILITMSENYGQSQLYVWRLNFNGQGTYLEGEPRPLLNNPVSTNGEAIVAMREDIPELVIMSGAGLNITRVNCLSDYPSPPTNFFTVMGADLSHFYDGFVSQGKLFFVSASPDGHFDHTRIHVLYLDGDRSLRTEHCKPDPQRGMPSARKQAALATTSGFLLLAGGEIDYGTSIVRLVDYWVLSLDTFTWMQISAQMPIPLIEPRLTVSNTDNVYLWGDFDQPLPGMPAGTHLRILRLTGINMNPPSYENALKQPKTAPLPSLYPSAQAPYPDLQSGEGFGQTQPPPYGLQQSTVPAPYPQQGQQPSYQPPGFQPGQYPATQPGAYPSTQPSAYPGQYPQQQTYPQGPPAQQPYPQGSSPQQPYPQGPSTQQQTYPQAPQAPVGQYAHYPPEEKKDCVVQ